MTESEDWARRRLQQLGDTELLLGGSATADRVVARYRRRRRARAAWSGIAAAVVLAVSIPVALAATRSEPTTQNGGIAAPSIASRSTSPAGPTVLANPARPEPGVAYRFDLYTHCGIRWARFGGREWTAIHPAADPERLPDSTGTTRYTGYVAGTMRLVGPDLLRFTLTDPYAAGQGRSFDFVPARGPLPLCE